MYVGGVGGGGVIIKHHINILFHPLLMLLGKNLAERLLVGQPVTVVAEDALIPNHYCSLAFVKFTIDFLFFTSTTWFQNIKRTVLICFDEQLLLSTGEKLQSSFSQM